jgi:ankyrin repeat protein
MSLPDDVKEGILLACRYGELEDVQAFVEKHGQGSIPEISDENGNTILHMASANGHAGEQLSTTVYLHLKIGFYRATHRTIRFSSFSGPFTIPCGTESRGFNRTALGSIKSTIGGFAKANPLS